MKFTYDEYGRLLGYLVEKGYSIAGYDNYEMSDKSVILRHDIDISMDKAVQMARFESLLGGIKSTYFILISSDFYNVFSKKTHESIYEIKRCGHTIGLHFDEKKYFGKEYVWSKEEVLEKILYEKQLAEKMIGDKINVVSMHTPSEETLNGDLRIPQMINSYSQEFFREFKYVSDSYHRWREDIWRIVENDAPDKLHILTHPFWYNDEPKSRNESFLQYIEEGKNYRFRLIETNVLPPNTTLEQSLKDEEGNLTE